MRCRRTRPAVHAEKWGRGIHQLALITWSQCWTDQSHSLLDVSQLSLQPTSGALLLPHVLSDSDEVLLAVVVRVREADAPLKGDHRPGAVGKDECVAGALRRVPARPVDDPLLVDLHRGRTDTSTPTVEPHPTCHDARSCRPPPGAERHA